jgi:hypothetical protein
VNESLTHHTVQPQGIREQVDGLLTSVRAPSLQVADGSRTYLRQVSKRLLSKSSEKAVRTEDFMEWRIVCVARRGGGIQSPELHRRMSPFEKFADRALITKY